MSSHVLPITKIVFYKHGVGFFERKGIISGEKHLKLSFKKKDMNDILKSLIVLDRDPAGKVVSVSYDTQEDVEQIIREKSINLSKWNKFIDLLTALTGYEITVHVKGEEITGTVVGVNYNQEHKDFSQNLFSLYVPEKKKILTWSLLDITDIDLKDETANKDLTFFLEKSIAERKKDERFVTVILDGESHDLVIKYVASAPVWRVSYRLIYESETNKCLLMGWGVVNNTLEEDLENVKLVLTTGMPISFVYDLYTPRILERQEIKDEARAIPKPVELEPEMKPRLARRPMSGIMNIPRGSAPMAQPMMEEAKQAYFGADEPAPLMSELSEKTEISATGAKEGQFFKYNISTPVTVKRGQSAMVPILTQYFDCTKEHVYTAKKGEKNPYITLSFKNNSSCIFERGPVTVVEDDSYVGEAIVPFISKDQQVRLPYAVDVEVTVKEENKNFDVFNSLFFDEKQAGNYLFYREVYHIAETIYTANNNSDSPVNLVIEHPPFGTGYVIFETEEPVEKTENYMRWKMTVPPCSSHILKVKERTKLYRYEYYQNLTMNTLSGWLKERYLDESTFSELKIIMEFFDKKKMITEEIQRLNDEVNSIYESQKSLMEQLKVLGERGDEGALRKRYVNTLEVHQNRLEEIKKKEEELNIKTLELNKMIFDNIVKLSKKN
ncbi:MAG: hypothetical protein ABRQ37_00605 [Candidatus Eremiobacterota bacterium]